MSETWHEFSGETWQKDLLGDTSPTAEFEKAGLKCNTQVQHYHWSMITAIQMAHAAP